MGTCFCWASRVPETVCVEIRATEIRASIWVPPRVESQEERRVRLVPPAQGKGKGKGPQQEPPAVFKAPPAAWALGPRLPRHVSTSASDAEQER